MNQFPSPLLFSIWRGVSEGRGEGYAYSVTSMIKKKIISAIISPLTRSISHWLIALILISGSDILLSFSFAQENSIDSILQSSAHDSVKISSVFSLMKNYNSNGEFYKTIQAGEKLLSVFQKIEDKKKESLIYSAIGVAHYQKGNFAKALEYYFKALKIREEMNDVMGQSTMYNNIGLVYQDMDKYDLAKQYLFQGLIFRGKTGDSLAIAKSQNNIGLLYYAIGAKSDSLKKEIMFDSAMHYFNLSLAIAKSFDSKNNISYAIGNMGNVLKDRGKPKEALKQYLACLKIGEETEDKFSVMVSKIQIGDLYKEMNDFKKAIGYYCEALKSSKELENYENMKFCYVGLSFAYEKSGDYKTSLEMFRNFSLIKDTLLNSESNKQIAEMQTIYDTEKKDTEIKLLNKDKEVSEADKKKQKIILYSVIIGLMLVLLFSIFIYKGYKQKQLANVQLEKKNNEIFHQKKEIEEKNSEMLSSIRYAKRIQQAVLKAEKKVTAHLPDHFVLFKPKDIVSGDFYWAAEKAVVGSSSKKESAGLPTTATNYQPSTTVSELPTPNSELIWYVAAADCTGHGVPGAFLTMLGTSYLNEIVTSEIFLQPAEILNKLRDKVVKELSGTEGETKDGMDISLIALNLQTNELQWAGANNPFYLIRNNEQRAINNEQLTEVKADKQPIGFHPKPFPFTNHNFNVQKGDSFYIFTDGYADQFGGPKGKKFRYSQFEKIFVSIQNQSMEKQKEILNETIDKWKGNLEQVDDICVIGVRI